VAPLSAESLHRRPAGFGAALVVSALLAGCASPQPTLTAATPTALSQPSTAEIAATSPITPTAPSSPTPGPGLPELLGTPVAKLAAADLAGADADYQSLATLYPHNAEPWLGRAALAQRQSDWAAALKDLETAAAVDPQNMEALRQWALLLEARGDNAEVVKVYDRMVALKPGDANLLVARAQAYARIGGTAVALADLKSAERIDPNREFAWLNVSGAAYGTRQYQTAVDLAGAGLAAHPGSTGLLMQRGLAELSLGDGQTAIQDFDAASQLDPALPAAYHWKGRALLMQGDYSHAADALKQAASLGVQSGVEDVNLAYESMAFAADAMARSNVDAAFSYLADNVISYGSRDPLLLGYGLVRWRQGSIDQALTRMDALVGTGYTPALYWRGAINFDQKKRADAIADLQSFLGLQHSGPDVESARTMLKTLGVDPDATATPSP